MENDKLSSALVGAGGATLWWFAQDQNDRDQRIRDNSLDLRDLNRRMTDFTRSADWIRLQAPIVRDEIVGTAAASPVATQPQTIPPLTTGVVRPDVTAGNNISTMQWPPAVGVYEAGGKTAMPGEMALAAYVRTYQEPRVFDQGLVNHVFTSNGLQQLFWSAQGLSWQSQARNLSQQQWQSVWSNILALGGAGTPTPTPTPTPTSDVHTDPTKVPIATNMLASSIVPLNDMAGLPANPYRNPQTDAASRWRVVSAGVGNNAGDKLAHITFKTEYIGKNAVGETVSFQPVVVTNRQFQIYADNITSTGFDLVAATALNGSTVFDVFCAVVGGV